jgi:hypothetical protein
MELLEIGQALRDGFDPEEISAVARQTGVLVEEEDFESARELIDRMDPQEIPDGPEREQPEEEDEEDERPDLPPFDIPDYVQEMMDDEEITWRELHPSLKAMLQGRNPHARRRRAMQRIIDAGVGSPSELESARIRKAEAERVLARQDAMIKGSVFFKDRR